MNVRLIGSTLAVLASFTAYRPATAAPELYAVDPEHTSIIFSVSHAALSYTYGIFRQASGNYYFDKDNPANCRFQFEIQADSLDTNHAKRDTHLKSNGFFSVQEFPTITFNSTACARANSPEGAIVYNVTGNLTIHGVTLQVTLPLRMLGEGEGPSKDYRTGFLTEFRLKRSDYGMTNLLNNNLVGDAVAITVSFEGIRQDAAGAPPARPAR